MQKLIGISMAVLATILFAGNVFATSGIQVVHITYQVNNDEDARITGGGYWALDSYNKNITIWDMGANASEAGAHDYIVNAMYSGTFCTYAGVLSPNFHTPEPSDGCGTMTASYDAEIYGTTISIDNTAGSLHPASGSPGTGTFDFLGSKSDILGAQNGNSASYSWVGNYFPGYTGFCYISCPGQTSMLDWQWTYSLPNGAIGGTLYTQSAAGETGDIVTGNSNVLATIEVPQATCGITISGGPLNFNTVNQGQVSNLASVDVKNVGTVPTTTFNIAGTIWSGILGNTMPVDQTHWALTSFTYGSGDTALTGTPVSINGGILGAGNTVTPNFAVQIPVSQPGDTYSQVITFNAGC